MRREGRGAGIALALLAVVAVLSSCASAPKNPAPGTPEEGRVSTPSAGDAPAASDSPDSAAPSAPPSGGGAVSIAIPKNVSRSYFYSIDKHVLELAEDGSVESLRQVAALLRRGVAEEYADNEKVLLSICASVMRIVWPSEAFAWDVPAVDFSNPYTGAIDSAERGLYDSSTGNSDFFTIILPSLLLLTNSSRDDYYGEAGDALEKGIAMRRNSVLANYLMGVLRMRLNENGEAVAYLGRALAQSPENREIRLAQTLAYNAAGDFADALGMAEGLLEDDAQNVSLLELCCRAATALGDYARAENYVLRVLQLEPENLQFVLLRARILIAKGDFIKASSLLDVYARSNVADRDYLILRAQLQKDWNKNNTEAGKTIGRALSYYPDDPVVLQFAASIASETSSSIGGYTALDLADRVLEMEPGNTAAMKICVTELGKDGRYEEAYAMSSQLMEQPGAGDDVVYAHVEVCLALDYTDEAWRLASALYEASPADEGVQQVYLKVLVATGRRAQAAQLIDSLMPSANARMKSFLYYQKSLLDTDSETILGDLRSSLTANPRNRDALYRLYRIYYDRQDWRRAQYYLKQVLALNHTDAAILALNAELDTLIGK